MSQNLYILMQINDSVFPIGGYTQSYGLETYILNDSVKSKEDVFTYISTNLKTAFLYSELLVMSLAYDYASSGQFNKIIELDHIMKVSKTPREIRVASHKLGARFVKTVSVIHNVNYCNESFLDYAKAVANKETLPNHAVAQGVFCASLGIEKKQAMSFYCYASSSAMVTNSVKAVPLSQTVGQQILFDLSPLHDKIIEEALTLDISYVGLSMPGFDIRCMQHEVLYSRLYMS